MAEIEIVYRNGYCEYAQSDYFTQCHTQCAEDLGCRCFSDVEERSNAVPVCLVEAIKILESKQAMVILHQPGQGFGADGKERRA